MTIHKVDIRPGVSVLSVLRHLNYRPWYALGEFVDNSIQSFTKHRESLRRIHGEDFKLLVEINIDSTSSSRISIRDNAAGILESEYSRAFRPAAIPADRTGLAEFGMGMKSAACWFAPYWTVRTSAINESVLRTVHFDIENIVNDDVKELTIEETREAPEKHYTEIFLEDVFHVPVGRTVTKLKNHLTDIYREFMRNGILELRFNDELLAYREPKILNAPHFRDKGGPKKWRKEIELDLGGGLLVHGFAALLETASTAKAGFSLFRRGRVIQGSGDDGYRPVEIFGRSNSYRYQRLFGELHLSGFDVSHTKDGFRWDENEEPFLQLLREYLDSKELPLLEQAEGYRARATVPQLTKSANQAVDNTAQALKDHLPGVIPAVADAELVDTPAEEMPHTSTIARRVFDIRFEGREWTVNVELTNDRTEGQWLVVTDTTESQQPRHLDIRVSMAHPFMVRFAQENSQNVEALLRVAAAIAVAEVLARDSGVRMAGTMRRNINEILRDALSGP